MSEENLNEELLASLGNPENDTVEMPPISPQPAARAVSVTNPGAKGEATGGETMSQELTVEQQARVDEIVEALKDVMDPELGINIVDLGLLYGLHLDGDDLLLDMTLTSAGCPLTDLIEQQCRFVLGDLVDSVSINWVWLPPWGPDKITDDGREQLRALGFNV